MQRTLYFMLLLLFYQNAKAADTTKTLSPRQLLQVVKQYHPLSQMAETGVKISQAEITMARAPFDPVLQYKAGAKSFDGVEYYNERTTELVIPTWYGIEIKASTANLSGSRLNPEETGGLTSFAGLSIPLAKNLLMDKRRAALQKAKLMNGMALAEQRSVLNNLYYEAVQAYWQWVQSWQLYRVAETAVKANEQRFLWVKKTWQQGDRAAIDTVEAFVQWQQFIYQRNESWLNVQQSVVDLSAFLWKPGNQGYDLPADVQPPANWETETGFPAPALEELLQAARSKHPDLQQYTIKLRYLEVEKKLQFQELLPSVNFQYNQLAKGGNLVKTAPAFPLFDNNYRYGFSVGIPLRFSQGRGAYRRAKLQISETEQARRQKEMLIVNKVRTAFNEWVNLEQQRSLQQSLYNGYLRLLKAEETRFFNGESSLFVVNSRELKRLEAEQKLVEVKIKQLKTRFTLQWAAGLLVTAG